MGPRPLARAAYGPLVPAAPRAFAECAPRPPGAPPPSAAGHLWTSSPSGAPGLRRVRLPSSGSAPALRKCLTLRLRWPGRCPGALPAPSWSPRGWPQRVASSWTSSGSWPSLLCTRRDQPALKYILLPTPCHVPCLGHSFLPNPTLHLDSRPCPPKGAGFSLSGRPPKSQTVTVSLSL